MRSVCVAIIMGGAIIGSLPAFAGLANVTISDQWVDSGSSNSWYNGGGSGVGGADNEVGPGTYANESWDLEGTFWNAQTDQLTLFGGWNFQGTQGDSFNPFTGSYAPIDGTVRSGDIFISTGTPKYGNGANAGTPSLYAANVSDGTNTHDEVYNNFGYNYVLHMNWATGTYDILGINSNSVLLTQDIVNDPNNFPGGPWTYASGASSTIASNQTATITSYAAADTSWTTTYGSFLGDSTIGGAAVPYGRYAVTVDLGSIASSLPLDDTLTTHFTMECANDNLMGQVDLTPVPEPCSTIALMGMGLGVVLARRRRQALA